MNTEVSTEMGDEEGMTSYEQIWSNVVLAGEVVVTVAPEDVDPLKAGIKNVKARQVQENKSKELPTVQGRLVFGTRPSKEYPEAIDVVITLAQEGGVKIFKMNVPDTEM